MFSLITRLFGRSANSKSLAKNRLQMVLTQDRSGLTAQDMDFFKKDLIEVISKYFETDRNEVVVDWHRESGTTALLINMPVVGRHSEPKRAATA